jgi:hypothetical protein
LSVATLVAFVFIALIPGQEYASPYGQYVLTLSIVVGIIAAVIGILVYLVWPIKTPAQPELEVEIGQRSLGTPQDLTYLLRKDAPSLRAYRYQCLTVKACEVGVKALMAKTCIDGGRPHFLDWVPKPTEHDSKNPKRVDLVPEEEAQLLIWYAAKSAFGPDKNFPFEFTLNSEEFFTSDSARLNKTHFDITIRFIAENYTDKEPRHFRLNAESWDTLNLDWVD